MFANYYSPCWRAADGGPMRGTAAADSVIGQFLKALKLRVLTCTPQAGMLIPAFSFLHLPSLYFLHTSVEEYLLMCEVLLGDWRVG